MPLALGQLAGEDRVERGVEVVAGVELHGDVVVEVLALARIGRPGRHRDDAVLVGQTDDGLVRAAEERIHGADAAGDGLVVRLGGAGDVVEVAGRDVRRPRTPSSTACRPAWKARNASLSKSRSQQPRNAADVESVSCSSSPVAYPAE